MLSLTEKEADGKQEFFEQLGMELKVKSFYVYMLLITPELNAHAYIHNYCIHYVFL